MVEKKLSQKYFSGFHDLQAELTQVELTLVGESCNARSATGTPLKRAFARPANAEHLKMFENLTEDEQINFRKRWSELGRVLSRHASSMQRGAG